MNEEERQLWNFFKSLVREMRGRNCDIINARNSNQIMLAITLIDMDINDYIKLNPHSINLQTGKTNAQVLGEYQEIDVKYLLLNKRRRQNE